MQWTERSMARCEVHHYLLIDSTQRYNTFSRYNSVYKNYRKYESDPLQRRTNEEKLEKDKIIPM